MAFSIDTKKILIKSELTTISSFPPITNDDPQTGAGFGITAQSNTQTLLQIATTVARSLDACLEMKVYW